MQLPMNQATHVFPVDDYQLSIELDPTNPDPTFVLKSLSLTDPTIVSYLQLEYTNPNLSTSITVKDLTGTGISYEIETNVTLPSDGVTPFNFRLVPQIDFVEVEDASGNFFRAGIGTSDLRNCQARLLDYTFWFGPGTRECTSYWKIDLVSVLNMNQKQLIVTSQSQIENVCAVAETNCVTISEHCTSSNQNNIALDQSDNELDGNEEGNGLIELLAVGVSNEINAPHNRAIFRSFFRSLKRPDGTQIPLCISAEDDGRTCETVVEVLAEAGISRSDYEVAGYKVFESEGKLPAVSQWLRNTLLVSQGNDGVPEFLQSAALDFNGSNQVQKLAEVAAAKVATREDAFIGGNVLVGDDFILVGADLFLYHENAADFDLLAHIESLYGTEKDIISVGNQFGVPKTQFGPFPSRNPIPHIDMFISLAGRIPSGINAGKYLLFVGEPMSTNGDFPQGGSPQDFDDVIADILSDGRFVVCRNPITYLPDTDSPLNANGNAAPIWASANNTLTEITSCNRTVYLPVFSSASLKGFPDVPKRVVPSLDLIRQQDETNKRLWEEAGFEVQPVGPMLFWAAQGGTLRCIASELKRNLRA